MTPTQVKIAGAAALALLAWLLTPKKPGRRSSELVIDANVYSPTFGLPIVEGDAAAAADPRANWNPDLRRLVEESERAIAAQEAEDLS